jgi:hypothetical protein
LKLYKIFGVAALLACSTLVATASTIITNPAGLVTKNFDSSGSDGSGDSISGPGIFFNVGNEELSLPTGGNVTFTFASPLATFGFDQGGDHGDITAVTLSNGDPITTTLPFLVGDGFYGITSATNFTSATLTFSVPQGNSFVITDFRLGSAANAPEPATLALIAPLLLAGLAAVRLRKRSVR